MSIQASGKDQTSTRHHAPYAVIDLCTSLSRLQYAANPFDPSVSSISDPAAVLADSVSLLPDAAVLKIRERCLDVKRTNTNRSELSTGYAGQV